MFWREPPHLDHSLVKKYTLGHFSIWSAHVAAHVVSWYMVVSKSKRPQKNGERKKIVALQLFKKNVFLPSLFLKKMEKKWRKRSLRTRETKNYQPKVKSTYMYCVYVCWWCVYDTYKSFIKFFNHKINHVALLFLRTEFLKHSRGAQNKTAVQL